MNADRTLVRQRRGLLDRETTRKRCGILHLRRGLPQIRREHLLHVWCVVHTAMSVARDEKASENEPRNYSVSQCPHAHCGRNKHNKLTDTIHTWSQGADREGVKYSLTGGDGLHLKRAQIHALERQFVTWAKRFRRPH